jgi:tellurite resistance protein TehA-like permease
VDTSSAPPVGEDAPAAGGRSLLQRLRATRSDPSLRREADMMAFYLAITLMVALSVAKDAAPPPMAELLLIIWGTTVGLALAHWFALGLSAYLVDDPALHHTPGEMLFSQLVMAVALAVVASVAVAVVPLVQEELPTGRVAIALFVGALVVVESRARGHRLARALALGAVALGIALAVTVVKLALH